MSSKELPERWAKRLISRGFKDPRYKVDTPSMSALASKLDMHTSTISNAMKGKTKPDIETVNALVAELGGDVAAWLGVEHFGSWDPPESSTLLTPRQRKAVEELIVSITTEEEVGGHGNRPAQKKALKPGEIRTGEGHSVKWPTPTPEP